MFLDLTKSPEFMTALKDAIKVAAAEVARETAGQGDDPAEVWLTAREARAFLRMGDSAWYEFKAGQEQLTAEAREIVISYSLQGSPRYQLASLQRFMRKGAVGLPDPLPGMAEHVPAKPAAKQRGVSLRHNGGR